MKWFGRKAAPVARPLLHRGYAGAAGAGEWPRNYEAQVREAYLGNPVAQRAVRLVAESVAWAPVYATDGAAGPAALGAGARAGRPRPCSRRWRRSCCCTAMPSSRSCSTPTGRRRSCSRSGPSG